MDLVPCRLCGGGGLVDTGGVEPWGISIERCCPACDGTGKVERPSPKYDFTITCPNPGPTTDPRCLADNGRRMPPGPVPLPHCDGCVCYYQTHDDAWLSDAPAPAPAPKPRAVRPPPSLERCPNCDDLALVHRPGHPAICRGCGYEERR